MCEVNIHSNRYFVLRTTVVATGQAFRRRAVSGIISSKEVLKDTKQGH